MDSNLASEQLNRSRRASFWKYLPGFPKKSKTKREIEEQDVTLISANKLHSSFRSLAQKTTERNEDFNETSFLTSDNQLRWGNPRDPKNRHVQFVPTPMNKYHIYREASGGDKENAEPVKLDDSYRKSMDDQFNESTFDQTQKIDTSRMNKSLFDGKEKKVTTLPRTSTKSNLTDNLGVTFSSCDVSCIRRESLGAGYPSKRNVHTDGEPRRFSDVFENYPNRSSITSGDLRIPFAPKPIQTAGQMNVTAIIGQTAVDSALVQPQLNKVGVSKLCPSGKPPERAEKKMGEKLRHDCEKSITDSHMKFPENDDSAFLKPWQIPKKNIRKGPRHRYPNPNESVSADAPVVHLFGPTQSSRKSLQKTHCDLDVSRETRGIERLIDGHVLKAPQRNTCCNHECNIKQLADDDGNKEYVEQKHSARQSFKVPSNLQYSKNAFLSFRAKSKPSVSAVPGKEQFPGEGKYCSYKMERKYDGMSSLADDECSLNCSCYDCLDDVSFRKEKRLSRSDSVKSRLFFPADNSMPSVHNNPNEELVFRDKLQGCWYDCNDSMCQSPEAGGTEVSKGSKGQKLHTQKGMKTSRGKEDILISDDYEITHNGGNQQYPEKGATEKKLPTTSSSPAKCSDRTRDTKGFPGHKTITRCSSDMSPNSKKLSESCVFALQETLKNLLNDSRLKTSFTISSLDSSDSSDKPSTIVIQIQNNFGRDLSTTTNDASTNASFDKKKVLDETQDSHLSRTRSMPEMHFDTSKSGCEHSSVSCSDAQSTKSDPPVENTLASCDVLNDLQDVESNSGYSTISSTLSLHQREDESAIHDQKILQELIRIGKGLPPPSKSPKKVPIVFSPRKHKFKAKDVLSGRAKLKLNIYNNCGMITVHVVKAAKLASVRTMKLNPYVKVSLHPDESRRAHWRTNVVENDSNPEFNQKFSFEIVPEDSKKRLIFSVWHRDREKKRSEFLGCMSFGVYHVVGSNQSLSGWYRLLKEVVGTKKHFAAGHGNTLAKLLAR